MTDQDRPALSRRRFLQASTLATGAPALTGTRSAEAAAYAAGRPSRPNILILMCDEMRFPPIYASADIRAFRQRYLKTQNLLAQNGMSFERHYAASVACTPSRTSLYTGQYPSLHGATNTTGAAKESFEPDMFWLDPNTVPTMGDYFRSAGYATFWRGKWHASDADILIPGTHNQLLSYDAATGAPSRRGEQLYSAADRLQSFGFSGWIGPEPHGTSPLNSGSSVPPGQRGRDVGYAHQTKSLIESLSRDGDSRPWLIMSSFVNPHDITLWGLWVNLGIAPGFDFEIEEGVVPQHVFEAALFHKTKNDNLARKPSAQASYQQSYATWMQPILDNPATLHRYYRYYYQLHKNVDEQMMVVYDALMRSRFARNTIVVFTSDHGDLLGSHHGMHQKWYTAYDEALRVPFIISNPTLFPRPKVVDTLTSHVDLLPTLLGLAGVNAAAAREELAKSHSEARPLVGRDLSGLVLGETPPARFDDPIYFMTDDDPSRGENQQNWTGVGYASVVQPNHLETVIARLNNKVWKFSRYFDNPQFWSSPGTPVNRSVEDVVLLQKDPNPRIDGTYDIACEVTVKHTPKREEFEMYNVSDDPMELRNLYNDGLHSAEQRKLASLLQQQCAAKRLVPCSGPVPGQPECGQPGCR